MALAAFIPYIITFTGIAAGTFIIYQIRVTVQSVEEVFTNEGSALNSIAFQAIVGGLLVYLITRMVK